MAVAKVRRVTSPQQLGLSEGSDRFEHEEPHLARLVLHRTDQALVQQRCKRVQERPWRRHRNRLGGRQPEASDKDGQRPEYLLLRLREQLVAPPDRGLKSLMAHDPIGPPAGQQSESVIQPSEQDLRAEQPQPWSSELDGQRKSVKLPACARPPRRSRR